MDTGLAGTTAEATVGVTTSGATTSGATTSGLTGSTAASTTGAATGDVGITAPTTTGSPLPNLGSVPNPRGAGLIGNGVGVNGDNQQVGFVATDGNPGAGNAHVYRVSGSQNGSTFGGYTVVVVGS